LTVTAGGDLTIGRPDAAQSVLHAAQSISISSTGYTNDSGVAVGGNLAVISVPGGYSTALTKQLTLFAANYLHLHESFSASDKLSMRGGQTMITRRSVLRNLATRMQADGPAAGPVLDALSRSVATISGTRLELQSGTILRLEQQVGSGDQFAADSEIVLTAGDIIVQVDPVDPLDGDADMTAGDIIVQVDPAESKDGEAESNRRVVAPNTTMAGALTGAGSLIKRGDGTLQLDAANTYTGRTVLESGQLIINGSTVPESRFEILGGTLSGHGSIGGEVVVSNGAVLSPGSSPGILSSGSLTLTSGSTYVVEIEGHSPGTGYDQTVVTGAVDLGGRRRLTSASQVLSRMTGTNLSSSTMTEPTP
jgi:autotransporter-associated beta strand protein